MACYPSGNLRDIAFLGVYRRFCGVLLFRRVFGRVFCSVRSAASVRQIGGVLISRAYLEAIQDRRVDGLQPAGALETISAESVQLYVEKADTRRILRRMTA